MGKVIAIAGEMMVGKDEFAKALINKGFVQGSFAGNLKNMCQVVFGLSDFHMNTQEGKLKTLNPPIDFDRRKLQKIIEWVKSTHSLETSAAALKEIDRIYVEEYVQEHKAYKKFTSPREVFQFVGTEICRKISEDYHAEVLVNKMKKEPEVNWVITDARFPNERKILKENFDCILVRLKRPGFTPDHLLNSLDKKGQLQPVVGHVAENSLGTDEEYDQIIINGGTIEDLHQDALKLS